VNATWQRTLAAAAGCKNVSQMQDHTIAYRRSWPIWSAIACADRHARQLGFRLSQLADQFTPLETRAVMRDNQFVVA
jgi:hypothetical protein